MKKLFTLIFLTLANLTFSQKTTFPLYPDGIPNSLPIENTEKSEMFDKVQIVSNVTVPQLLYFPAAKEKANGACVIICPGGGYSILAAGHEGTDVAKELNKFGVTAFVLKYRIPNDKAQPIKEIAPLQDAQHAIRTVRKQAKKFGVNANRIGILGFSAGGHLASTAGTHYLNPVGELADSTNVRPDFMILGYPVISFQPYGHKGSAESLLGKDASAEKLAYYSNEMHVNANTPPTFLVHASDDYGVPVKNSLVFYEALVENKVPAEMHLYPKGGHGFGMINPTTKDLWMSRLKNWMDSMGWLKKI
jgi:acetyl esterase/lipase